MAFEATSGIQVANHYGPRDTGGSAGVERTTKSLNVFSVELTGDSLVEGFLSNFVIPKHAHMLRAFLTVDQPFDLGAGTSGVSVGEGDDPTVNGITITVADLEAEGVHDVTSALTGTWEATDGNFTDRASRIGIDIGDSDVDASVGRGTITIEYLYKVRDDTEWAPDPDTFPAYPAQA